MQRVGGIHKQKTLLPALSRTPANRTRLAPIWTGAALDTVAPVRYGVVRLARITGFLGLVTSKVVRTTFPR